MLGKVEASVDRIFMARGRSADPIANLRWWECLSPSSTDTSIDHMERPAKKPRLQGPDGFQKPKQTSRYKPPESITKFVSAFDNVLPPSPVKPDAALPKGPPKKRPKPVSVVTHERPRNPFDVPRGLEAGSSKPSLPKQQLKTSSSAHPPRVAKADKPLPPLKVLKPPVFLPIATSLQTTKVKPSSKTAGAHPSSLQPLLKPPPAPSEKPRSVLKPPPVPTIPSSTKPSVPLKPLAPPPPLPEHLSASPKKHMKTILTTNVAQATDPTKEGSGAELLSLFLQQHGHNFTSSTDRELQRGVMVSPDKRSRGKDPKFVRYVVAVVRVSLAAPSHLISSPAVVAWRNVFNIAYRVQKQTLCYGNARWNRKSNLGQSWRQTCSFAFSESSTSPKRLNDRAS